MDDDCNPKLCDFGLARCFPKSFSNSMKMTVTGQIGSPLYMAPEIIESANYGPGVDIYSFSMIAYEIMTGKEPYYEIIDSLTPFKFWNKVVSGTRPKLTNDISNKMKKLLKRCWSSDAKERPSADEIFHLLSTDFSYSMEDVDEDEINDYLESIEEISSDEIPKKDDDTDPFIKNCLDILKKQYQKPQNRNHILISACETGNKELVEYILSQKGIDVNAKIILYIYIFNLI